MGYLFATPTCQFDVVEGKATGNQWVPWYTMHKIVAGLVDVYKFEGNATLCRSRASWGTGSTRAHQAGIRHAKSKVLGRSTAA